jgi:hypothetical protein
MKKTSSKGFSDFDGGSIVIDIPYDATEQREAIKRLGGKFNGETKKWHIPKNEKNEAEAKSRGWID